MNIIFKKLVIFSYKFCFYKVKGKKLPTTPNFYYNIKRRETKN